MASACYTCLLICSYLLLATVSSVSGFAPVIYNTDNSSECSHGGPQQDDEQLARIIKQAHQQLGPPGCNPPQNKSCQDILYCFPSASSGYHEITLPNGTIVQVYCNMEGTNCGGQRGWTRVVYVNMSQPNAICPQGLPQRSVNGLPYCGWFSGTGCASALLNITINYNQVCGRVAGYQENLPGAFRYGTNINIDQFYFVGLAIMYGRPRKHIWTYTASYDYNLNDIYTCPCNSGSTNQVPSFVGNDYYCESGNNGPSGGCTSRLYSEDVLWDGKQCGDIESSCCTHPNMPWFIKTLSETTSDDIELRACGSDSCWGIAPIFLIELYVR